MNAEERERFKKDIKLPKSIKKGTLLEAEHFQAIADLFELMFKEGRCVVSFD